MAGRGRAIAKKAAELRRPGNSATSLPPVADLKLTESQFENVKIEDWTDESSIVSSINNSQSVADLTAAGSRLCDYALNGELDQTHIAMAVFKQTAKFTIDEINFRSQYLQALQMLFQNRAEISETPTKLINLAVLLCETSLALPSLNVMSLAALQCLQLLLEQRNETQIEIFATQLPKLKLSSEHETELDRLMLVVRNAIIDEQTTPASRKLLLKVLELYLNKWEKLDKRMDDFYD